MTTPEFIRPNQVSKTALSVGWILSVLPVLMLGFSAVLKLLNPPDVREMFGTLGWPEQYTLALGILELGCAAVYVIPRTSVLGAILVTGYMGGAIATHVRIGKLMVLPQIGLGVLAWLGLYLRDPRLRALVPLRS
jgi:hypothetical protein